MHGQWDAVRRWERDHQLVLREHGLPTIIHMETMVMFCEARLEVERDALHAALKARSSWMVPVHREMIAYWDEKTREHKTQLRVVRCWLERRSCA